MWQQPDLAEQWEPLMVSKDYDPRPIAHREKSSISIAFSATEKQGGSDIRRNMIEAKPAGHAGHGREYILTGHAASRCPTSARAISPSAWRSHCRRRRSSVTRRTRSPMPFCATRLGGAGGQAFGTMPAGIDQNAILERSFDAG